MYLQRIAMQYVNGRYENLVSDEPMREYQAFTLVCNQRDAIDAEYYALCMRVRWHLLIVTLCDTGNEKYNAITYGLTTDPIVAYNEGILAPMCKLLSLSEASVNTKHIVGRVVFFCPYNPKGKPFDVILRSQLKHLHITEQDVDAVSESMADTPTTVNVDMFEDLPIDSKIAVLLRDT